MISDSEVLINKWQSGWAKIQMTLTHLPTGVVVHGEETSEFILRDRLLKELEKKIKDEGWVQKWVKHPS